ncbi:hypothetical protein [Yersinia enterocolitica]|nr:hypothetical protein [Yersinia enterocolitica]HEI6940493.1 hypothetical protein [Yersinia enterocolitica]
MDSYQDEDYVNDLTDRVFLIKQELEAGKIKIASHLIEGFISSFEKVRLRSDGKVDPSTVDGRIRSMGAVVNHFIERDTIKNKYSIYDLQKAYFDILFSNFGHIYQDMINSNVEPYVIASFLSRQEEYVKSLYDVFEDFFNDVVEFWETASDIGVFHLQDGKQLKANFAGDLFPSYSENAVSIAGLYVDTITLPCPILRVGRLYRAGNKNEFIRLLLKHVLTCMAYREIALEDIEPPIALILPDSRDYAEKDANYLMTASEPYVLAHAQYLYNRKFDSKEDFQEFSNSLTDVDKVLSHLKRPDRLIFDTSWGRDARSQLSTLLSDPDRLTRNLFGDHPGMEVFFSCVSRMPQALAAKKNAQELGSTPYINADTSWLYYTWLIEYESEGFNIDDVELKNLHMVHALSAGMQDGFSWLGNVPIKKVIELRRKDLMPEVRDILTSGIDKMINSVPSNYNQTSQQVIDNIDRAFIEHQRMLDKARREKLKIYGLDVTPCVVNGIIAITGAVTGNVALTTLSAGLATFGLPTIKDIKTKFKDRSEKLTAYQNSVTGILFSHKK